MDWFDKAKPLRQQGKSYNEIADILHKSIKTVQSRFRRSELYGEQPVEFTPKVENLQEAVLKDLSKECKVSDLCHKYKISDRVLEATIEDIKDSGYIVTEVNDTIKLCRNAVSEYNTFDEDWNGEKIIRFGVVSDCHLCSKWQQLTFLNHLYDVFEQEGIPIAYNPGDITDGYHMHPGHEYEVFKHGADEQEQYVIDVYPYRKGITTKFIIGNHDQSHIKAGGHNIGLPIAKARPDMQYLGMLNAKVNITPNCTVELNHPLDGASYAISYVTQKTVDAMTGGEKPNILLNGHHHKMLDMFYRNIQCYEAGTTCAQTPWMRGHRISAMMGGWIIEIHVDEEGTIKRCKGEKILLYKPLEHDYEE